MSYTDDALKAKLSALAETQESIVAVAQWVMFHKRFADRTATLWFQRLKDVPAPKRLNLIYLANEVVQQTKIRKKEDFLIAFSPIVAEATEFSYKGSSNDVQQKLRRVVEVWRQREIFEPNILADVESRLDEYDKTQPRAAASTKKPMLGGSLFSSSSSSATPVELVPLIPLQQALSKASMPLISTTKNAETDYAALNGEQPLPTHPVLAARLSALVKTLASAEDAVSESLKARIKLMDGLEKLLDSHRTERIKEEKQQQDLAAKRIAMSKRRQEVEDAIMRGLEMDTAAADVDRPEVESFTPPPDDIEESHTPPGLPPMVPHQVDGGADVSTPKKEEIKTEKHESVIAPEQAAPPPHIPAVNEYLPLPAAPQATLDPRRRPVVKMETEDVKPKVEESRATLGTNGHSQQPDYQVSKKRKIKDDYEGDSLDGLDPDVAGMLG